MIRRIYALLGCLALVLTFTSCGDKPPASSQEPSQSVSQPESQSPSSSVPQADDELAKQIVKAYGALEDENGTLRPGAISLYYLSDNSWDKPEDLEAKYYFSWFFSSTMEEDYEYKVEAYKNPKGDDMGWFFPQDIYEGRIQKYFEVSTDHLRSDPYFYDAELKGYYVGGGGGKGETPPIAYTYSQEGDVLTLDVTLNFEYQPKSHFVLTARLEPDGGWKYLSCKASQEPAA